MAEKGKPPDFVPTVPGRVSAFDPASVFARTEFDDAIDRAFDAMMAERLRILDEQMLSDAVSPPLGIFNERPDGNSI